MTALIGGLLASSCAKIPVTHYYQLASPAVASNPAPEPQNLLSSDHRRLEVAVPAFQVDAPYDQDRIVYRVGRDNVEVGFYEYHRWAAPLARTLPGLTAAVLDESAGSFVTVRPASGTGDYDGIVEGRLLALEEIDSPEGATAYVRIAITLRDAGGSPIWSQEVSAEATTGDGTVNAVMKVMSEAVLDALRLTRGGITGALLALSRRPD